MDIEVELISRETIKPSSSTPHHLRKFPLSLIDQFHPPWLTRIILFYTSVGGSNPSDTDVRDSVISELKLGLSRTLAHFYPLAGSVKGDLYVECNDQGLLFVETRVTNCDLSTFLKQPDRHRMYHHFLPSDGQASDPACQVETFQVHVQFNTFLCGGVALGLSFLHKVIDGAVISQFLKKWTSLTRIDGDLHKLDHVSDDGNTPFTPASVLFPSRETLPSNAGVWMGVCSMGDAKIGGGRFVFDAKAISSLREKASSENVLKPSTVEALTGFIWRCMIKASRAKSGTTKSALLSCTVNIRPRMDPPLPDNAIGNIVWKTVVKYKGGPDKSQAPELPSLVSLLRKSFWDMNSGYVEKLKGEGGLEEIKRWLDEVEKEYLDEGAEAYSFTSWCRMGYNEVDFGWGRPVWVAPGGVGSLNVLPSRAIFLVEAKVGEVEALVRMEEERMEILLQDPEFLAFASINPTVTISS